MRFAKFLSLFEELRNDDSIAVVLTTGAGDVAYCAGRDLSEFPTEGGKNRGTDRRAEPRAYHVAEVIRTFPKVTIAVVNGFCLGRRHYSVAAARSGDRIGQGAVRFA